MHASRPQTRSPFRNSSANASNAGLYWLSLLHSGPPVHRELQDRCDKELSASEKRISELEALVSGASSQSVRVQSASSAPRDRSKASNAREPVPASESKSYKPMRQKEQTPERESDSGDEDEKQHRNAKPSVKSQGKLLADESDGKSSDGDEAAPSAPVRSAVGSDAESDDGGDSDAKHAKPRTPNADAEAKRAGKNADDSDVDEVRGMYALSVCSRGNIAIAQAISILQGALRAHAARQQFLKCLRDEAEQAASATTSALKLGSGAISTLTKP